MAVFALALAADGRRSDPVLVRFVVDGDTIDVAGVGRVRLLGIDAPERAREFSSAEPFAQEAYDRLSGLIGRRWVRLESDPHETRDTYRRRLAYVLLEDGTFVNAVLVREGLARVSAGRWLSRLEELRRAEEEAMMLRRGLWGGRPLLPPKHYVLPRKKGDRRRPSPNSTSSSETDRRDESDRPSSQSRPAP
jgi:endonuclease YncB( thermonuclease family)